MDHGLTSDWVLQGMNARPRLFLLSLMVDALRASECLGRIGIF